MPKLVLRALRKARAPPLAETRLMTAHGQKCPAHTGALTGMTRQATARARGVCRPYPAQRCLALPIPLGGYEVVIA
jgi:hypothetical protein